MSRPGDVSPDGRWRWDGRAWVPAAPTPGPRGAGRVPKPAIVVAVVMAVLVVVVVGLAGYLNFGVSHGRTSSIVHPCDLLDPQMVQSILPGAIPNETPEQDGSDADCSWTSDGQKIGLTLWVSSSLLFTSAETRAHQFFEQMTESDAGRPHVNVGDEAVELIDDKLILVRSDNVVFQLALITDRPTDITLPAHEVNLKLGGT